MTIFYRYLYWSESGYTTVIEYGNLNGTGRTEAVIIENAKDLELAPNPEMRRIYWGNKLECAVYSANFDGSNRDQIGIIYCNYGSLALYGTLFKFL